MTALKLEYDDLFYKGIGCCEEEDEDRQPFDVMDTMVACTIDSVYDVVPEIRSKVCV